MASRIDFACHAIPVAAVAAGENIATETIARDPSKIFTGAGTVAVTYSNTLGYTTGTATYLTIASTGWTEITVLQSKLFLFIRNTGYTSSAFTTGTTAAIRVDVVDGSTADDVECMRIPTYGAVAIPLPNDSVDGTVWKIRSSSGPLCVEYFVTD